MIKLGLPQYKVLNETTKGNSKVEVRLYPAHKRTVYVCDREYFLPIPNMVFGIHWLKHEEYSYQDGAWTFVGCTNKKNNMVYPSLFWSARFGDSGWRVCLDENGHFRQAVYYTFDALATKYWQYVFGGFNYGQMKDWAKLSLEEAQSRIVEYSAKK
jgi:hypothetical protein